MKATINGMKMSFADLVRLYKVEVPIIQRDYAQGRTTPKAESIRKAFISDLLKALEEHKQLDSGQQKGLDLAFVYGRVDNGVFIPVDGQQRLTTLYLLHLYLVKRCKKNSTQCEECKYEKLLSRFTYATRQSSREFCEKISSSVGETNIIPPAESAERLKDYVIDQPWFFVEWEDDPTIAGMLEVLDEIHSQIGKTRFPNEELPDFLSILFGDYCPIRFNFLDMGIQGLSDDVYLKMNARGLPLDDFERFKSDFEKYLKQKEEGLAHIPTPSMATGFSGQSWAAIPNYKRIIYRFNLNWGDEFWTRYNTNSQKRLISVVARFFAMSATAMSSADTTRLGDKIRELVDIADDRAEYLSFKPFEAVINELEAKTLFKQLFRFLDNIVQLRTKGIRTDPSWRIKNDQEIDILNPSNISERLIFLVLALFPYDISIQENELREWLRVVWNIVENSNVEEKNYNEYITLFSQWFEASSDVGLRQYLASLDYKGKLANAQIVQECEKARLLNNGNEWIEYIFKEEREPFFHGDIAVQLAPRDGTPISLSAAKARSEFLAPYIVQGIPSEKGIEFVKLLIQHLQNFEALYALFGHEYGDFTFNDKNYHRWTRNKEALAALLAVINREPAIDHSSFGEIWHRRLFALLLCKESILDCQRSGLPHEARIHWIQGHYYLHKSYDRNYYYLLDVPLYMVLEHLKAHGEISFGDCEQNENGWFYHEPIRILFKGNEFRIGATHVMKTTRQGQTISHAWYFYSSSPTIEVYATRMKEAIEKLLLKDSTSEATPE